MSKPRFSSLEQWLGWQESAHSKEIDLGLERTQQVALALGLLVQTSAASAATNGFPARVMTVAGTNGKGSCVATIEALLVSAGKTVGCLSSPHVSHYNERIRLNGNPVSDGLICQAFEAIDRARGNTSLSYFEFNTLAALYIFQHHTVDYIVLEVGLGGRLDATNIIDADRALITSIAIDHTAWLGDTREQIAREKAGIIKAGSEVICGDIDPPQSLLEQIQTLNCPFMVINRDFAIERDSGQIVFRHRALGQTHCYSVPEQNLRLPVESVAMALQACLLEGLMGQVKQPEQVLSSVCLPGRFQQLSINGVNCLLDVAHNPASIQRLIENIEGHKKNTRGRFSMLFAVMADKNVAKLVEVLAPHVSQWLLLEIQNNVRAMNVNELKTLIENHLCERNITDVKIESCTSVAQGLAFYAKAHGQPTCEFVDRPNKRLNDLSGCSPNEMLEDELLKESFLVVSGSFAVVSETLSAIK